MQASHQETIVRACALILTPNQEFKEWLKTTALGDNIFPASIDKVIDEDALYHHSVAFITPVFHGQDELRDFIDRYSEYIFQSLLLAWPFSLEAWQQSTQRQSLGELFNSAYYFYLVNMLDQAVDTNAEITCSVTTIKPKLACLEWIHQSGIDEIEDLALDMLRKFGVALLSPSFKSPEEEQHFIQLNCQRIWELGLSCYCEDRSLWPPNRTYEHLIEFFDCHTVYPVVDLLKMRLKKAA